ncbi:CLUMA_CG016976, isoform A [Clunio marinus]|uniref:CLUMA_CG016976, isoform A n=1 Tax=Clunio marinus TaxID=568069 RepID=A0A1J1ISQ5_9DIPT|nr:CLUMA_CG016976, isoform A [Clunio marinus]
MAAHNRLKFNIKLPTILTNITNVYELQQFNNERRREKIFYALIELFGNINRDMFTAWSNVSAKYPTGL